MAFYKQISDVRVVSSISSIQSMSTTQRLLIAAATDHQFSITKFPQPPTDQLLWKDFPKAKKKIGQICSASISCNMKALLTRYCINDNVRLEPFKTLYIITKTQSKHRNTGLKFNRIEAL